MLFEFKDINTIFKELSTPITFNAYISSDAVLPDTLKVLKNDLKDILEDLKAKAPTKFQYKFIEPNKEIAKELYERYGFKPMVGSLLSNNAFYFYMLLDNKTETHAVMLPNDYQKASLEQSIDNTLKRFSKGYIKTVGVSSPKTNFNMGAYGYTRTGKSYQILMQKLQETYKTKVIDLESGIVPEDVDILLINAPSEYGEKAVYAIDQFLMKGGSVIFNTATHQTTRTQNSVSITSLNTGLEKWFTHHGITFDKELVLDENNENYPVPINRKFRWHSRAGVKNDSLPYIR
ncbi:MAG: GldG family protein [Bdellovibrionota bacterium]